MRELRKKHSKAAGARNSRKLLEQSAELQKSFGHLFSGKEIIYLNVKNLKPNFLTLKLCWMPVTKTDGSKLYGN